MDDEMKHLLNGIKEAIALEPIYAFLRRLKSPSRGITLERYVFFK